LLNDPWITQFDLSKEEHLKVLNSEEIVKNMMNYKLMTNKLAKTVTSIYVGTTLSSEDL